MKTTSKLLITACVITLAGCAEGPNLRGGQYWEKTDIQDQIYVRGEQGQRSLDRDIASCTMELREAIAARPINDAIPPNGPVKTFDQAVQDWDTPEHSGMLRTEHSDYQDMAGCMKAKGWQQRDNVPYDVADEARAGWYLANKRYGYDPRIGRIEEEEDAVEYGNLND